MGFNFGTCVVVTGVALQAVAIALLSVALTQPNFFMSYFPDPAGTNYEYKTDGYGEDCVAAQIGLLSSKYDPLCTGGVTSGKVAFEVSTTDYYPLFPIRLIENEYNPLKALGVPYTGCESTIDNMYAVGNQVAQGSASSLLAMLSQLPAPLFVSPSLWLVPSGQGYQALQLGLRGAVAAGLIDEAAAQQANDTAVPLLQACTAAPDSSFASCSAFITNYLGSSTINEYLSIAFNKEITSRDMAVQSCEDDNEDYEVLQTAKSCWIASLTFTCIAFLTAFAVQFVSNKKAMLMSIFTTLFAATSGILVLIAFLELNSAPATSDIGGECVPGRACYEKESNVYVGLVAMVLNVVCAVLFLVYGIQLFRNRNASPRETERKINLESSSQSSREDNSLQGEDSDRKLEVNKPEMEV